MPAGPLHHAHRSPSAMPAGPPPPCPPVPLRHARRSPSVMPTGPLRHAHRSPLHHARRYPLSVIPAGCKRESKVFSPPPKTAMRRPTTPNAAAPGSRPVPLDSRLRGNDSRVRRGERPTTTPAPSVTPSGPPLSFPPLPFLSFPQVVSGNPWSFLLPPKADMKRPTTPTRPAPGSRPVPLDSRLRGNDSRVRRRDHPTTNPAPSVTSVGPLPSFPPVPSVMPARPPPSLPPVPSVMPAGPPFLSFPQVVSGNPWSFLLPRRQTWSAPPPPTRPAPGSRPMPLDSRLRGNDSSVYW